MDRWYGKKMESRQRERARAVAAVQRATGSTAPGATGTDTSIGTPAEIAGKLLALFKSEDVPAWRATLLVVTRPYAGTDKRVVDAAREALADPDPLVRSAAVQVLNASPERGSVGRMLQDPSRLVRLDAEWSLSDQLADNSPERQEFNAYLAANADQPAGQLRIAQDLFNRGRVAEAEAPLRKAVAWDPNFEEAYATLGTVLNSLDRNAESAAAFWRASQLNKADPNLTFNAALAFAAAQKFPDAELALRETIRRAPGNDRAWYNLGLLLAQSSREAEGIEALRQAEKLAPTVADYPYARATIHWKRGERDAAVAAAKRALEIDPENQGARSLLDAAK
jgi:tetratricopeptide (TPR) repeat protein